MIYIFGLLYVVSFFANGENKKNNQIVNVLLGIVPVPVIGALIAIASSPGVSGLSVIESLFVPALICVLITLILMIVKFRWFWKKIYS